jgi:hypothetical protein
MINRNIKVGALIAESIDISYSNDYSTVIEVLNDKVIIKDKEFFFYFSFSCSI